ncbi:MFS transporter [Microvirga sesbaniae]|uniref:MFS transporter n=1 Tax=Microvirga sesbaniae TaxID=681392 RepID=UPI0021C5BC83|nr:MFS transporter [Microvirga sp. HBU67692]
MLSILANKTFRSLFIAQLVAVLGTGLATVALSLMAYDIAGAQAGSVLGTALAIKMIASVSLAPIAAALAERFSRKSILVGLDLLRAAVMVAFPFVTEVWQIYCLIFVLQAASAGFTPTMRATIPDVLPDERDYTRALSLTQLTYDLESVVSPVIAALLLTFFSFHELFAGTVLGFLASAAFIAVTILPARRIILQDRIAKRTLTGMRIYIGTPRLRGLLAFSFVASCGSAMIIVNTVVLVQANMGLTQTATALALATYGAGSMIAALCVPYLLEVVADRKAMLIGAGFIILGMLAAGFIESFTLILPIMLVLGMGYGLIQTPAGRLIRRSSGDHDRATVFAAQFSFTHMCWLINYPLAGWLGATIGLPSTFLLLGGLAMLATVSAVRLWPRRDPEVLAHTHDNLAPDHQHVHDGRIQGRTLSHAHVFVLDELHTRWPADR